MNKKLAISFCAAALLAGCANYRWTSSVPAEMRTVQVPVFIDKSNLTETGPVVTRQVLREFQREGTFKVLADGAALEVQGTVLSATGTDMNANYKNGRRTHGGTLRIVASVSVIDKRAGRVLVDNRQLAGEAPFSSGQDANTAKRDAAGRAADDLARNIVDMVTTLNWRK